jgi:hypothetical protein
MSINPGDNDLIEGYILGKLNDAEKQSFESRLRVDREFARKFRLLKTFPEMMSTQGRLEFEKKLAEATSPVLKKKSIRFKNPPNLVWAAILCTVLIGTVLLFILMKQDHKTEKVVPKGNESGRTDIVKSETVPVKDTLVIIQPQKRQPENKEIREVPEKSVQKAVELINPAGGMKFSRKEMILFKWKQKTDTFTRFYIISESSDHVVLWRGINPGTREYKVPGNSLYPGNYYWYVGSKQEKRSFTVSD